MKPNVLSIAGSDPSGGAGVQADLKAIAAQGCYGMAALTALTAQNTRGVEGVHLVPARFVAAQVDAVFDDIDVAAVKIGMIGAADIAEAVAETLEDRRQAWVVLDPVMIAKGGDRLLAEDAVETLRTRLLPMASVVTPNLPEAAALLGTEEPRELAEMEEAAQALLALGPRAVLLKGGHLSGAPVDVLARAGARPVRLEGVRRATRNTHGTGCTLSAALAAQLALTGELEVSARRAKDYVARAIAAADALNVGSGHGPLDHFPD